jgi:hypothetical protein
MICRTCFEVHKRCKSDVIYIQNKIANEKVAYSNKFYIFLQNEHKSKTSAPGVFFIHNIYINSFNEICFPPVLSCDKSYFGSKIE